VLQNFDDSQGVYRPQEKKTLFQLAGRTIEIAGRNCSLHTGGYDCQYMYDLITFDAELEESYECEHVEVDCICPGLYVPLNREKRLILVKYSISKQLISINTVPAGADMCHGLDC
jgi:hypothetical protein